jgi:ribonuclease HI
MSQDRTYIHKNDVEWYMDKHAVTSHEAWAHLTELKRKYNEDADCLEELATLTRAPTPCVSEGGDEPLDWGSDGECVSPTSHTSSANYCTGMLMGLHLIKTKKGNKTGCVLNADNQAALTAINSGMTKSGQHLAAVIHNTIKKLLPKKGTNSRFRLTFRWSAGHVGIEGNETADAEAKKAVEGESSDKKDLPLYLCKPIQYSLSAV